MRAARWPMMSCVSSTGSARRSRRGSPCRSNSRSSSGEVNPMVKTYSVAVLLGGPSSEREISLRSGRAIAGALSGAGHRVTEVDVRGDDGTELEGLEAEIVFVALHGRFGEDGQVQRLLERRRLLYTGSSPVASRLAMGKLGSKR